MKKDAPKEIDAIIKLAYEKGLVSWSGDAFVDTGKGHWVSVENLEKFIKLVRHYEQTT